MSDTHNQILSRLKSINITSFLNPSYISKLYQLYHVFGPRGILEIGLLYILKGKYYFQSKLIKVNCNGNIYNGRYTISDLLGRGENKIEFGNIDNFRIIPFIFPTVCPDLFSLLICKLSIKKRARLELPNYIAISPAVLISFKNKQLERLIENSFTAKNLIYNRYYNEVQVIKTCELGENLFRNGLHVPFVNKKAVEEIEQTFMSYLKTLFYKRMESVRTNRELEMVKKQKVNFKNKDDFHNNIINNKDDIDIDDSVEITDDLVNYVKKLGNYIFLQVCIYVLTSFHTDLMNTNNDNDNTIHNNRNNGDNNKEEDDYIINGHDKDSIYNTYIFDKSRNKYYPINHYLTKHLITTIRSNTKAILPIVQITLIKLKFNNTGFESLRTPNFMQIPYSWEVDYKNKVLNKETKMFQLKCKLHKTYPFSNNSKNNLLKEDNIKENCEYNNNNKNNRKKKVVLNTDILQEIENAALMEMFAKKDNFIHAPNYLYSLKKPMFTQFYEYLGAQGMLELGLLASSRRPFSLSSGAKITIKNSYFNEKFGLLDLQKLQLINIKHRRRINRKDSNDVTPNRLLDYIPELVALLRYKIGIEEGCLAADKDHLLPASLNFSQTELIEFNSTMIQNNAVERNCVHNYEIYVSDKYMEFHKEKIKNVNYKRVVEDLEGKYVEWYNEVYEGMYEEHKNDFENENEFFKGIYFDHPTDEPSDDEDIA